MMEAQAYQLYLAHAHTIKVWQMYQYYIQMQHDYTARLVAWHYGAWNDYNLSL